MKQAAFFFGSGISVPSGLPRVYDITNAIFDDDWHFTSCKRFFPGKNHNPAFIDSTTPRVVEFLGIVKEFASEYISKLPEWGNGPEPHYEHLYSLVEQAHLVSTSHVANLAVVEFSDRLKNSVSNISNDFRGIGPGAGEFADLCETACEFIHWVVHHYLSKRVKSKGLDVIPAVAKSVDQLDIITLNHDTLVEDELSSYGIDFEDGFSPVKIDGGLNIKGDLTPFNNWPGKTSVSIIKLHGSLNWQLFEFNDFDGKGEKVRQYAKFKKDPDHCRDEYNNLVTPVKWKSAFLSGTVVKEQYYITPFWWELQNEFNRKINDHRFLIFCGYGFQDPGVNIKINQWLHNLDTTKRQLVILTPESEDEFLKPKPYWIKRAYDNSQIQFVGKYLQDCRIDDLANYFSER